MTLAFAILFLGMSSTAQPMQAAWQAPPAQQPATPANSSANAPATQEGSPSSQAAPPPAAPAATKPPATAQQKTASGSSGGKKSNHKKKVAASGCDAAATTSSAPAAASNSSGAAPADSATAGNTPAEANATSTAQKNCPPQKIIVRQGGTAEPSIQLAGSPSGNQGSQKDSTNQMLERTEGNLKKIAGRQLTTTQEQTVSQIRQFVDQSKSALAAGDSERAHTLAWKAELLSEDLVKPQQ
jgi:hypothetical protein